MFKWKKQNKDAYSSSFCRCVNTILNFGFELIGARPSTDYPIGSQSNLIILNRSNLERHTHNWILDHFRLFWTRGLIVASDLCKLWSSREKSRLMFVCGWWGAIFKNKQKVFNFFFKSRFWIFNRLRWV